MFDDDEREHMPLEAREIHQQLLDDSSQWARTLPSDARVAEFARTLPRRMPSPSASPTRNVLTHRRPSSTLPDMMSVKGHTSMLKLQGARRALAASIAAVAVVALIAGVLYGANNRHGTQSVSSTVKTPTSAPGSVYGATPGPLSKYIPTAYTAHGISETWTPTRATTQFRTGDWVFVVMDVRGLPKGTHVVSIGWFMNGNYFDFPGGRDAFAKTIDSDGRVFFGLMPSSGPRGGQGMVKIYIDRPASDPNESPQDPYLAYTLTFLYEGDEMPGPQGRFVYEIGTANYPSSTGTPPNVTSTFKPGDWVYLVALMHGLPQGTHAISVVWYLNGIPLELGPSAQTTKTINGDTRVVFGLQFPTSGSGIVKIYIDRPASDTSESDSDPYLADTVKFTIEGPAPTVAPGSSTPTPSPGPTLTPFVTTPTPHP